MMTNYNSNNFPSSNYRMLKERMSKTSKGFWKVQLIHKLTKRLSQKFNTEDFLMMKHIKKPDQVIPSFIKFTSEKSLLINSQNKIKNKQILESLNRSKFFITTEDINQNILLREKYFSLQREQKKNMYNNFYRHFPYEPQLYNEMQLVCLRGSPRFVPRKFKEVVKDCFEMDRYNKYLKNLKNLHTLNYNFSSAENSQEKEKKKNFDNNRIINSESKKKIFKWEGERNLTEVSDRGVRPKIKGRGREERGERGGELTSALKSHIYKGGNSHKSTNEITNSACVNNYFLNSNNAYTISEPNEFNVNAKRIFEKEYKGELPFIKKEKNPKYVDKYVESEN